MPTQETAQAALERILLNLAYDNEEMLARAKSFAAEELNLTLEELTNALLGDSEESN